MLHGYSVKGHVGPKAKGNNNVRPHAHVIITFLPGKKTLSQYQPYRHQTPARQAKTINSTTSYFLPQKIQHYEPENKG